MFNVCFYAFAEQSHPIALSPPLLPAPAAPVNAAVVRRTACPYFWFRDPLDTAIKKLVRPATALSKTRRKELYIQQKLPREVFEDLMQPLQESDAVGLKRDAATGLLIPTSTTKALLKFDYNIRRGSVSDRLFHLQTLDPPVKQRRKQAEAVQILQAGEDDAYEVEEIREKRTMGKKTEYLIKWQGWAETTNTWVSASPIVVPRPSCEMACLAVHMCIFRVGCIRSRERE